MIDNLLITTNGDIQNTKTGNWLVGDVNNVGYRRVRSNRKRYFVHRLVAMEYIPNPNNLPQVNHKNGNKLDNRVENLEWCTASYNSNHRSNILNKVRGVNHGCSKLSEDEVLDIRSKLSSCDYSTRKLANMFNVSQKTIMNIKHKETWNHI
ncbi:HNH endonuclease [Klebsiella pneumoniae]|nr:HNH endonuclease [Klebsiella pneumoniae]ELQ8980644.1 HNH endonuclease [Klebsiella pneumoniae]